MMESIEKLREYAEQCCPEYEDYDARMIEIADAIEAEIKSRYMLLPVDADGAPIRCGDEVTTDALWNEKWSVFAVASDYWVDVDGCTHKPCATHHAKPDPLKELLSELANEVWEASCTCQTTWSDSGLDGIEERYAERIRELMEVDE